MAKILSVHVPLSASQYSKATGASLGSGVTASGALANSSGSGLYTYNSGTGVYTATATIIVVLSFTTGATANVTTQPTIVCSEGTILSNSLAITNYNINCTLTARLTAGQTWSYRNDSSTATYTAFSTAFTTNS